MKRQQAHSPGQSVAAPREQHNCTHSPCRGKSINYQIFTVLYCIYIYAFALAQGAGIVDIWFPGCRYALPRAMCLLPFQGALVLYFTNFDMLNQACLCAILSERTCIHAHSLNHVFMPKERSYLYPPKKILYFYSKRKSMSLFQKNTSSCPSANRCWSIIEKRPPKIRLYGIKLLILQLVCLLSKVWTMN